MFLHFQDILFLFAGTRATKLFSLLKADAAYIDPCTSACQEPGLRKVAQVVRFLAFWFSSLYAFVFISDAFSHS